MDNPPSFSALPPSGRDPKKGRRLQFLAVILAIVVAIASFFLPWRSSNAFYSYLLGLPFALFYIGMLYLFLQGRKYRVPSAQQSQAEDPRPPVIYLRSFKDDFLAAQSVHGMFALWALIGIAPNKTEEEILADELCPFGPVIAIGRPGEELPTLGAARMYVDSDVWHEKVEEHLNAANLVVLRLGSTEGLWWELEQSINKIHPERFVVIVPVIRGEAKLKAIHERASALFPKPLPPFEGARKLLFVRQLGTLRGLLYFDADWTPHYVNLTKRSWPLKYFFRFASLSVDGARIQWALRPLYARLNIPWALPPVRWGATLFYVFTLFLPLLLLVFLIFFFTYLAIFDRI